MIQRLKRIAQRKSSIHKSYQRCFETPDGKAVLADLCRRYKVFIPKKFDKDTCQADYVAEQVILSILHYAKLNHDRLVKMMEEQINDYEQQDIT